MRKLICLAATFSVCHIFGLGNLWIGFTAVFLLLSLKFGDSFLWEIPLGVLSCSVLQLAFADDIKIAIQFLILFSTVIISYAYPRKLPLFFLVSAMALFFENAWSIAAIWATVWFGVRSALGYFTTKKTSLQE